MEDQVMRVGLGRRKADGNGNGGSISKGLMIWPIVIQTLILLGAIIGVWRNMESRILTHELKMVEVVERLDHQERDERNLDLQREKLHNACSGAQNPGCHRR